MTGKKDAFEFSELSFNAIESAAMNSSKSVWKRTFCNALENKIQRGRLRLIITAC